MHVCEVRRTTKRHRKAPVEDGGGEAALGDSPLLLQITIIITIITIITITFYTITEYI